eukprot:scaffold85685_cov66-Phaeocystis_antarctica.AAC.1
MVTREYPKIAIPSLGLGPRGRRARFFHISNRRCVSIAASCCALAWHGAELPADGRHRTAVAAAAVCGHVALRLRANHEVRRGRDVHVAARAAGGGRQRRVPGRVLEAGHVEHEQVVGGGVVPGDGREVPVARLAEGCAREGGGEQRRARARYGLDDLLAEGVDAALARTRALDHGAVAARDAGELVHSHAVLLDLGPRLAAVAK